MPTAAEQIARHVLRAPEFVRKLAATQARQPEEAWMLRQDAATRESFVTEVLDHGIDELRAQIWMLSQPEHVRQSYIAEVLEPKLHATTP
jgi:hypothetical protein